jgi:putative zinc finger protein
MTQIHCNLSHDREETLIAYLYDDIDPVVRASLEEHLETCERCRTELRSLGGVRKQLAQWAPPEPQFAHATAGGHSLPAAMAPAAARPWWRDIPAWAQVAAALLLLGVSAGIANLDVRYDHNGMTIRTGWSRAPAPAAASTPAAARTETSAPWRSDLSALERQLRAEIHSAQPAVVPAHSPSNDAEILRRVRTMIDESERRQQNELALRVGETIAEMNAKRQVDAFQLRRAVKEAENKLGVEMIRQRQSLTSLNNYILMNASQRQ